MKSRITWSSVLKKLHRRAASSRIARVFPHPDRIRHAFRL
jgi:hypothetical protein